MTDALAFAILLACTFPAVLHSYATGGDAVHEDHLITVKDGGLTLPGWFADLCVALAVIGGGIALQLYRPEIQFWNRPEALVVLLVCWLICILVAKTYARRAVAEETAKAPDGESAARAASYRASYRWYPVHIGMVLILCLVLIAKLGLGIGLDYLRNSAEIAAFVASTQAATAALPAVLAEEHVIAAVLNQSAFFAQRKLLFAQLEPLLVLTILAFSVNFILFVTPIGRGFRTSPLTTSRLLNTGIAASLLLAFAVIFFVQFGILLRAHLDHLQALEAAQIVELAHASAIADALRAAISLSGASGFTTALAQEAGLVLFGAFFVQKILPRMYGDRVVDQTTAPTAP